MRRFSGRENVQGVSIPPVKPPDAPQGRWVGESQSRAKLAFAMRFTESRI